jgi:hypothetical protein
MSTHTDASDTAAIQQRMRELRDEMNGDVEALVNSTEDLADWRKYVRAQPWLCVGAAAFLGFMLAPSRRRPQPKPAPATEAATKAGVVSGVATALVSALATAVARKAAAQMGDYLMDRFQHSGTESTADESFRHD